MSVYHGKLLELVSIDREANKSFLRISLSCTQKIELRWEIDQDTADNLQNITLFEKKFKYRLSFQSFWDSTKNQYISSLTRTYRDQSRSINFSCSEEYVKGLNSIKSIQQIGEIHKLTCFSINLPITEEREEHEDVNHRYYRRLPWSTVAIISIIATMLLGYSGHSFLSKTATAHSQETTVKVESVTREISVEIVSGHAENNAASEPESGIPTEELDQIITFSIPQGSVALTFDDGPSKYSKEIVDILKQYEVGGTFFFTGLNVQKYPEYVHYVHSNGYSIGNHSMNHANFTILSYENQESELIQTNQLIEEIIQQPVLLFRPPYGAKNEETIELMNKTQNKMVLWNKDTEDWKHRNSDEIFNYVLKSKASGAIILLHESQAVIDALPRIIEYLQEQELQIVNLR